MPIRWSPAGHGGLCFGYGQFVATGEKGQIFTTPAPGTLWLRSVATPSNLEGVVFANHRFVAVGDRGLMLTSVDAETWRGSVAPRPMRAITFFDGAFIGVSADGAVLESSDASSWVVASTGTDSLLTAIGSKGQSIVAVGFGGTILRSQKAIPVPPVLGPLADVTEAAGNNVVFTARAQPGPLRYQWSHDGQPIVGATNDQLVLSNVQLNDAGPYAVTVRNERGVATATATLNVVAAIPPPGEAFDPTFHAAPEVQTTTRALLVQSDGRIVTGGLAGVQRLNEDGTLDPTFPAEANLPIGRVTALAEQSDGKLLVGSASGDRAQLFRLTAHGALDLSFDASAAPLGTEIAQIVIAPDGKILLANLTSKVVRLNADGSVDSNFASADFGSFGTDPANPIVVKKLATVPDGKIVISASRRLEGGYPQSHVLIARLHDNGSLDTSFEPRWTGCSEPRLLASQPDGRLVLITDWYAGLMGGSWSALRLNDDGTDDATFPMSVGSFGKYGGSLRAAVDTDGRIVVVAGHNYSPIGLTVRRLSRNGDTDLTLRADRLPGVSFGNRLTALAVAPDGRGVVATESSVVRLVSQNAVAINPPRPLDDATPAPIRVNGGESVSVHTEFAGTGPLTYSWTIYDDDGTLRSPANSTGQAIVLPNLRTSATVLVNASNAAGSVTLPPQRIEVRPALPRIVSQTRSMEVAAGRVFILEFSADGSGPLSYEWFRDGKSLGGGPLGGASNGTWSIYSMTTDFAGRYELVLRNPLGEARSAPVIISLDESSRLGDVATRGYVGAGEQALIAGFVVNGQMPKWVLIRGVGPGLAPFGVADFLRDPVITLRDAAGNVIEQNDNWTVSSAQHGAFDRLKPFALADGSRDAVIIRSLNPGSYTVELRGVGDTTGIALVEVYESPTDAPRLSNVSSRVFVGTGAAAAIPGVIVTGDRPKTLLVRAVGPTLAGFGVGGVLADPTLTLVNAAGGTIATSDDWSTNTGPTTGTAATLSAAATRVGAFPLPEGSRDAALLVTLAPGAYTALVSGAHNTTGIALVEIYEVP